MKIMPAIEDRIMAEIRFAMAKDPLINIVGLQGHLEKKFDRVFTFQYVSRLHRKVAGKALAEVNRANLNRRIVQLRMDFELSRQALLKILCWDETMGTRPPSARDRAEAAKNLTMLNIAVMNAEVANGVYKNLEEAQQHHAALAIPEDKRNSVLSAINKWGYLPPGTTVQMTERQLTVHAGNTQPTN